MRLIHRGDLETLAGCLKKEFHSLLPLSYLPKKGEKIEESSHPSPLAQDMAFMQDVETVGESFLSGHLFSTPCQAQVGQTPGRARNVLDRFLGVPVPAARTRQDGNAGYSFSEPMRVIKFEEEARPS